MSHTTAKASAWSPLSYSLFRAIWLAALVSNIGTWMQNVGAAWSMTSLSASPLLVALLQAATSLPVLLLGFPTGAIADIVDRRRFLLFTQIWSALASLGLTVVTLTNLTTPWSLLGFTFALGIGAALARPVWQVIIPDLVPYEDLPAAIALNGVNINLSRAIGPALAGLLVAAVGPAAVFGIDSLSFLAVIIVLWRWQPAPKATNMPAERFLGALRAGSRYILHAPALQAVLIRIGIFVLAGSGLWALLPVLAKQELGLGASGYGILLSSLGAGAVVGASQMPKIRQYLSLNSLAIWATVVFALANLSLTRLDQLIPLCGVMFLAGFAWLGLMMSFNVAAQTAIPRWIKARALGAYQVVFQGGMAIGSVIWGIIATHLGISEAFGIATGVLLLGIAAAPRYPIRLGDQSSLTPSMHWAEPVMAIEPQPDDGPVLLQLEYQIQPENASAFVAAMENLKAIRLRDGAIRWGLFQDLEDHQRYVESFLVESWAEHERQHQRILQADLDIEQKAKSFHIGEQPPVVSHLIYKGS
ncbi:MAG: MFS transporter [Cyanobacteria bacterium P01_H01_bin.121]